MFTNPKTNKKFWLYYVVNCPVTFEAYLPDDDILLDEDTDDIEDYLDDDNALEMDVKETVEEYVEDKEEASLSVGDTEDSLFIMGKSETHEDTDNDTTMGDDVAMGNNATMRNNAPTTYLDSVNTSVTDNDNKDESNVLSDFLEIAEENAPVSNEATPAIKRGKATTAGKAQASGDKYKSGTIDEDNDNTMALFGIV